MTEKKTPVSETAPLVAGDLAKQREIHDTYAPVSAIEEKPTRELFAAAFVHACDDEGTFFGLEYVYEAAKRVATPAAHAALKALRGY